MEETGHIDWLYGVGKPETATGAPVVVAGKEVERSVRKTRVRLETKVLQKYGSLILQDQVQFTDQEILIRSLIAEPVGVGFPAPLDLNSGHGLPHCCSGPHPLVTMAGLCLFVREERDGKSPVHVISASRVTEITVSDSWADTEEFGGSDIVTLNS
ncbi:hypothetical protein AnigIFM60653_002912 [Aspergillus niger]|nr:hypothetical protein AnigIFM60653_002912 [Aspergillus niger]